MTNIIVQGFVSNKLITQGYHSGEAPPTPPSYAGMPRGAYISPRRLFQRRVNLHKIVSRPEREGD